MTTVFLVVLSMSISASWLIAALLMLRLLLRKMPKRSVILLWGLVGLRLLIPFSIESRLSLIPGNEPGATPVVSESGQIPEIWSLLWLMGVLLFTVYFLMSYWYFLRTLDTAVFLQEKTYQSDRIQAAVVVGIWRPKIYIPFRMESNSMAYILAHEQAHIRRRDHWWKLLAYFMLTLHWFNPLVWIAYVMLGRDMELACDEEVIRDLDTQARGDYAQALMMNSRRRHHSTVYRLCFGEIGVKERVRSVLNYQRPSAWHSVVLAVFSIVLGVCFLTDPVGASELVDSQNTIQEQVVQTRKYTPAPYTSSAPGPTRSAVLSMRSALEELNLELADLQAQYEQKDVPSLKVRIQSLKETIATVEEHLQRAEKQVEFLLNGGT